MAKRHTGEGKELSAYINPRRGKGEGRNKGRRKQKHFRLCPRKKTGENKKGKTNTLFQKERKAWKTIK